MGSVQISPKQYRRTLDPSTRLVNSYRQWFDLLPWTWQCVRTRSTAAAGANPTVTVNPLLEVQYTTNAPTVTYAADGLSITTGNTSGDGGTLTASCGSTAINPFVIGDSRTPPIPSSANFLRTGADTSSTSGNGITFSTTVKTPSTITSQDLAAGLQASGTATGSQDSVFSAGFIVGPVLAATTAITTTITDGAYFWYNPATGPNWMAVVGSSQITDTGVPVVASTKYELTISLSDNRTPQFFINEFEVAKVASGVALTADTPYVPFATIRTRAASAITWFVRQFLCSKVVA